MKYYLLALLLCLVSTTNLSKRSNLEQAKQDLTIDGSIVAYDPFSLNLVSSSPPAQFLVVRVNKIHQGTETSKYIKVIYEYFKPEQALSGKFLEVKKKRKLLLRRSPTCDGLIWGKEAHNYPIEPGDKAISRPLKRTVGAESENIPGDVELPCYILLQIDNNKAHSR